MVNERILICDDAPIMRLMLKNILAPEGYEVIGEATNGLEATELYKKVKPDLVLMDIIMSRYDGLFGLKEILNYDQKAKVIIITAIDQREELMQSIRLGAIDYIIKPFDDKRVLSAIEKSLGK